MLIKNIRIVRPFGNGYEKKDIRIENGRFSQIENELEPISGEEIFDGKNRLAFPGLVDAHMHTGIYNPLDEDAVTESMAAAMGGVTSSLNYIRTGRYYLNKTGPYKSFYNEVLDISKGRFFVDYSYHLAPINNEHIDEIEYLIENHGVTSFKIFMFYGNYGLHGASSNQHDFLMKPKEEIYDIAHFEFIMRGVQRALDRYPDKKDHISLSLHCETAEIMRAYTQMVQNEGELTGLKAYSAARPPHSEGLAIFIASYLANETNCININLLHLTSKKAVDAAMMMQAAFPHISFKREVTVAHLLLDYDCNCGLHAKVNPPIRSREDVEYLWQHLLAGNIDWVCSDHACCKAEYKVDKEYKYDVWLAKSGFGGSEYLLSGLYSEGIKRGLSINRIAELTSANPAKRFGLKTKGDIAVGYDADLAIVHENEKFIVGGTNSPSTQGYSVFEGFEFYAPVKSTFLRGNLIYHEGEIQGTPKGNYLFR
jgi:allantoinase